MPAPVVDFTLFGVPGSPDYHARKANFLDNLNSGFLSLWTQLIANGGKAFTSRAGAVSAGQGGIPGELGIIFTREGSALVVRGHAQTSDDPLFSTYPQWGVITRIDPATIMRDVGVITMANISGTADAVTAEYPLAAKQAGVNSFSGTTILEIIPIATNTGASEVTLSIEGSTPNAIRSGTGAVLRAGELIGGRSYLLRRRGVTWRIISGSVAINDLQARVWGTTVRELPTLAPPMSVDQISVASDVGHEVWRRLSSPPGTPDPLIHAQTADGRWWRKSESSVDLKARVTENASSAYTLNVGSPSAQSIPVSRSVVVTHVNGAQIWETTTAPSPATETEVLKRDANNRWWLRVLDTRFLEFRGTRIYSSRADAVTLLTSNPPPDVLHRIFSLEGSRLVIRSRAEPNNDPLFTSAPFWGIEYATPLVGTARFPLIQGDPYTYSVLRVDVGGAPGTQVDWQVSDTGEGTQGWSVVSSALTLRVPDSLLGKFLRFRSRSPWTNMGWAISNVIGPITEGAQSSPLDLGASVNGFGGSRRHVPVLPPRLNALDTLRGGMGAGPPLDLYRDADGVSGASWMGQVTAPLPTAACNLLTTYSPPGNVIHPCVVEFFNEFCGYRYVCAITAYPTGPSLEDPFVYGSNDRVNWTFLGGAPQPLAVKPSVAGAYNSDTFLTHDPRTGELVVGYRLYVPRDGSSSAETNSDVVLYVRTSRNGYVWSAPREILRVEADEEIMLAPTMIFDPETLTWHMWVIDRPVMHHWTATSLYGPWTKDSVEIALGSFNTPHHHEIKWVGDRLVCLLYARGDGQLFFGAFPEGSWNQITWNSSGVLNPRPTSLYKASFVPVYDAQANTVAFDIWWTEGAAGPAGGVNMGHGRKLQHSRTNAFPL